MRTRIQRWGHSLALRIPKPFAEVKLHEHIDVNLTVANGKLVVAPIAKSAPTLEVLLAQVTKRNLHGEVHAGPPVGGEVW